MRSRTPDARRETAPADRGSRRDIRRRGRSVSFTLLRRHRRHNLVHAFGGTIAVNPLFDLAAEAADQALDRPGRGIAQSANGVTLDLPRYVQQQVDLAVIGFAL